MNRHAKAPSAFTFGRKGFAAHALFAMAFAALFALAFASNASAGKIVDRVVAGSTSTGATQGLFDDPRGIAVNYANVADATTDPLGASTDGYVYVVDEDRMRVQVFSPDGTFRFMFGRGVENGGDGAQICDSSETPCTSVTSADDEEGEFDDPQGIAIDQSTGHVYVRDRDNRRVQQFEADGTFLRTWGHDVATAASPDNTGTGFEICTSLCKVGTTGALGGQFASSSTNSTGIAVVPAGAPNAGNVIVADPGNRRIQEFGPAGGFVRAWGWDVVVPGGTGDEILPINEQQQLKIGNGFIIDSGTYTLTFEGQTTSPIAFDSTAAQVDAALEALPAIGAGNVSVTGSAFLPGNTPHIQRTVEFTGALGGSDVPPITGDATNIKVVVGPPPPLVVEVTTTVPGGQQPGFEICTVAAECKAATNSLPPDRDGAFATNNPTHLAVDSGGTVYASDSALGNRVQRFDSTEAVASDLPKSSIDVAALTSTPTNNITSGLAVDPTNGNLFVARGSGFLDVLEFSDPDGPAAEADRHYQSTGFNGSSAANGIAIDGAGDDLYLSSSFGGHRVFAADDDGAPTAIVTVDPPTGLDAHSATFTGTVNPNGALPTTYRFQYSRNGVTWTDVAPPFDLGGGTSPLAVDDAVSGLEANTFYRLRIVTTKPFGNPDGISPELTFLTDAVGPELETLYPQKRTATTARLTGSINPNNLPTAYRFEYGTTTAYGSVAPVPDANVSGGVAQLVFAEVSGLAPQTTYHYRLIAVNDEGTTTGEDVAFTTRAAAASPQRAYEMVTPPFKSTRANVVLGRYEYNANPGLPSLDGETVIWSTEIFPLTDDVGAPTHFDARRIQRTAAGWTNRTLATLKIIGPVQAGSQQAGVGSSGDLSSFAWFSRDALLPHAGSAAQQTYTVRPGTGTEGFTAWLDDTEAHVTKFGLLVGQLVGEPALLNDAGTAMARVGEFRDLAEDPNTPGDEDPSGEQQFYATGGSVGHNNPGGRTIYHVQAADPDDLPGAPKDLVNECTGTGPDATALPARIGTGAATDTIGTQACTESDGGPDATGSGTVAHASPTVSSLDTESGEFKVGQLVSGGGIPGGTRITAVGAGTLTLSINFTAKASIFAQLTNGSNQITLQFAQTGTPQVGQTVSGPGIPPGTTLVAIEGATLTLSQAATATSSFTSILFDPPGPVIDLSAEAQHLTSTKGAGLGSGSKGEGKPKFGPLVTALSDDGRRVFFASPDPSASGLPNACTAATGFNTSCLPQLFVRQYDASGENPQVRWISRSRSNPVGEGSYDGATIAGQQIAELGTAVFQGASRDGSVVYFATNSPLTPDDPNAGSSITTGSAQDNSWDLYRYELPQDLSADPDDGVLTRISGGPSGNADPNTSSQPSGAALRYLSDGGERAFFVTRAPIAGADEAGPKGGSTVPGGTVGSNSVRNLYLYDVGESGADRYRFIAQLPATGDWNSCATTAMEAGRQVGTHSSAGFAIEMSKNCFRGTPDASHVLFSTRGQLTADDDDDAGDLYLYDAESDELVRVTAPPAGAVPYVCKDKGEQNDGIEEPVNDCNGQLSFTGAGIHQAGGETARGWGGLRYENIAKGPDGVVSVFFESRSELVPEDVNGDRMDVYQWRQGELSLISPGDSHDNSWFSGNSVDGQDVFFFTSKAIDPREIDFQDFDIYDARIGGGFPYTPPPTPCNVLAFECETEAAAPPAPRGASSAAFSGEGNHAAKAKRKPRKCAGKRKVRRKGKCVKRKAKRVKRKRAANKSRRASR